MGPFLGFSRTSMLWFSIFFVLTVIPTCLAETQAQNKSRPEGGYIKFGVDRDRYHRTGEIWMTFDADNATWEEIRNLKITPPDPDQKPEIKNQTVLLDFGLDSETRKVFNSSSITKATNLKLLISILSKC